MQALRQLLVRVRLYGQRLVDRQDLRKASLHTEQDTALDMVAQRQACRSSTVTSLIASSQRVQHFHEAASRPWPRRPTPPPKAVRQTARGYKAPRRLAKTYQQTHLQQERQVGAEASPDLRPQALGVLLNPLLQTGAAGRHKRGAVGVRAHPGTGWPWGWRAGHIAGSHVLTLDIKILSQSANRTGGFCPSLTSLLCAFLLHL